MMSMPREVSTQVDSARGRADLPANRDAGLPAAGVEVGNLRHQAAGRPALQFEGAAMIGWRGREVALQWG